MQIMIAAAATKSIDNLAREFSDKQETVNMMSHCILQQVMASLANSLTFLSPLIKALRRVFLHFPEKKKINFF